MSNNFSPSHSAAEYELKINEESQSANYNQHNAHDENPVDHANLSIDRPPRASISSASAADIAATVQLGSSNQIVESSQPRNDLRAKSG
jgi:hypothetical protein